jgi:hypothetical protein
MYSVTQTCEQYPHMSKDRVEYERQRLGTIWLDHYAMLAAAAAGCVQCVQHYHERGGYASVWSGSFSDPRFNAWRSTFENQTAATLHGQESVRRYLGTLLRAEANIKETQENWKKNKLLQLRQQLMDESRKQLSSQCSGIYNDTQVQQALDSFLEKSSRREGDQGGSHRAAQSEPTCTICEQLGCAACYVIYLGPFWQDVAVPGSERLLSRIKGNAESIKVCRNCILTFIQNCDQQMQVISQTFSHQPTIMLSDASAPRLHKAHVLILALLKRQCVMAMQHGPVCV